ncbi:hypothetical protein Rsub_04807 [Raphidocelis subcapitata]|uniref:Uncharacterized protein n=1 Tax=Raphidocelis subcapitata TaxID=307507 RepID=A0A2V0NTZ3_9CHLO|nr:hypothetical protein Rsub_04807 [Raphidocelis subcapitata]|eukprot:GBF91138.1 hypothetical protein Rsub_04807 [Raphidocelis subcapitata]
MHGRKWVGLVFDVGQSNGATLLEHLWWVEKALATVEKDYWTSKAALEAATDAHVGNQARLKVLKGVLTVTDSELGAPRFEPPDEALSFKLDWLQRMDKLRNEYVTSLGRNDDKTVQERVAAAVRKESNAAIGEILADKHQELSAQLKKAYEELTIAQAKTEDKHAMNEQMAKIEQQQQQLQLQQQQMQQQEEQLQQLQQLLQNRRGNIPGLTSPQASPPPTATVAAAEPAPAAGTAPGAAAAAAAAAAAPEPAPAAAAVAAQPPSGAVLVALVNKLDAQLVEPCGGEDDTTTPAVKEGARKGSQSGAATPAASGGSGAGNNSDADDGTASKRRRCE